ncbi:MAG TPA: carboxypeptidase-like regulatory domain-containing protein [Vicinamibacterales bacterium]|jgi:carboxypeptidase family protein|nr:carboxypeptidase-like regulatory domain-containing protein [Vicinamibacterales bacterium]
MKYTATRLLPALFALALVAWMPSSELIAQGRGGGAGGGAQGGAFGQGGGRQQQLPTRDQVGGNQGGDQAAGTAVIRGRVVAADSGMPVRRAQVRAQAGEIRANRLVSTDAQGRFELKDLPAGRWTLTASKAGYMTLRYGQKRSFEAGTPIEIGDGQLMERADFALPKGAAITGRIFDEYGDAVANARVQVLRYQTVQGQRRLTPAGGGDQTDDTGAYRIYGLAPGDYYLSATLRANNGPFFDDGNNDTTSYASTYYPGTGSVSEAQRITLGVGQEQPNVTFALQPVRTVKITGTALNSMGTALTNGMVTLMPADNVGPGGGPGPVLFNFGGNGRVRADGSFTIANVSPGNYTLMAVAGPGGGRGGGFAIRIGGPGGPGLDDIELASIPLSVANEDITGLTVVTSKGASLSGSVIAAEGSVAKLSTNQIQIVAQPANGQFLPGPLGNRPARVENDGTFVLTGLTGQKFVRVNGLPQEWTLKAVMLNGVDVTDSALEFRGSTENSGLQVILTDKVSDVNGKVTTARGEVTRDYTVVVFPDDPTKWAFPSRFVKTGRADQQGQFRIRALPPDDRYLAVAVDYLEDGEGTDPQFLEQIKDRATRFALGDGESKSLDLKIINR